MSLDTTVGSPTGDSMITVAEADTIIAASFPTDYTEWENLDTPVKEQMLRNGAAFFSYLPLRGEPVSTEQAMPFPRTVQTNQIIIPQVIKEAQAEITFNIIFRTYKAHPSIDLGTSSAAQVKKFSLGGLLSIDFSEKSDASGSIMEQFTRGVNSLTWIKLVKYISQIRGAVI